MNRETNLGTIVLTWLWLLLSLAFLHELSPHPWIATINGRAGAGFLCMFYSMLFSGFFMHTEYYRRMYNSMPRSG